jgi:GTPase
MHDHPQVENESYRSGFVALIGRPNVGKSALLNRLVGQKIAISTHVPQTTRHRIRGVVTTRKSQVVFLDSPGFSKPLDNLGKYLSEEGQAALQEADMLVAVMDGALPPGKGDIWILQQVIATGKPFVVVANKLDLALALRAKHLKPTRDGRRRPPEMTQFKKEFVSGYEALLASLMPEGRTPPPVLAVSAHQGAGVQGMLDHLRTLLPEGPAYYGEEDVTDQRLREMSAELIREQLLIQLYEELPHSVAVSIDTFDESDPALIRIAATLFVNAASQKGMVIGKKGETIKALGSGARVSLEALLETQVFLDLQVKVKPNWRKDEAFLKALNLASSTIV